MICICPQGYVFTWIDIFLKKKQPKKNETVVKLITI